MRQAAMGWPIAPQRHRSAGQRNITMQPLSMPSICLVAFVITVAVSDLHSRRIPNWLTVGAASLGLVTSVMVDGPWAALGSLAGLGVGLAAFLPFYLARGFSAGD